MVMPKGVAIRGHISMTVIVGAIAAHSLEVEVFMVGTPTINLIKIRVSLIGPLRQCFIF